jgi:hypothetical protein
MVLKLRLFNSIRQEVGPIISDTYPDLDPQLRAFLSTHEKTVYISFGSRAYLSQENNGIILQFILESVNAKIFDGVIWSLGQTTLDDLPSTIRLPTSNSVVNVSKILHSHPHIRVLNGLSQQFVTLNHSHTRVFLTNGGTESIYEGLYTATPMLALPILPSDVANAQRLLNHHNLALTMSKDSLTVAELTRKVNILLTDPSIRANAKRMQFLATINAKRKYYAAELIEYVLFTAAQSGANGETNYFPEWETPDRRMGWIKGSNLDVITFVGGLALSGIILIGYALWNFVDIVEKVSTLVVTKKIRNNYNERRVKRR